MEFRIDFAMVRRVLREEHAQAVSEIRSLGPIEALGASQSRHDARLAAAADAPTLACSQGCSWCCHFTVDVRPVEVFRILDFVEAEFPPERIARLRSDVAVSSADVARLSAIERMQRTAKCPFLDGGGRCEIYPVRPQTCRNYHATDAAGCQLSYEQPDNLDIDPEFAPLVYQAGGAHVEAFSSAMEEAGFDVAAFELNMALEAAMLDPGSRSRFLMHQPPFTELRGEEVPPEFGEDD